MEKNLKQEEALKKFTKLVNEIKICMLITNTKQKDHTRPMATIDVEANGTLWFYTDIRSIKVEELSANSQVHLVYAHPGKESYLDVWGRASVVTDKQTIKDKWSTFVKAWFPNGVDDPNLALLKVEPNDNYYWDAETGKMISFLKIAASIVTGEKLADAVEGKINI
jgi:general stress protein 26